MGTSAARIASSPLVTAVVLGGGEPGDRMASQAGVEAKALVALDGKPMGAYVLEALRACPEVGRIVYVGPTNVRLRGLYDVAVPSGQRLVDSMALGLGAALGGAPAARLLVLTADIPWITGPGLSAFIAAAPDADLVYPAVTEAASVARFPHQQRTYVRLHDGRLTGGNAVLLAAEAVPRLLPLMDRAFRARKNPLALARMFGADVLVSVLLGRARIASLEGRLERMSGIRARALVTDDAALAADVDRVAHLPEGLSEGRPGLPGAEA
ncbi:MAG TPA: NTP transferase domain-containing protein [Trueperaceae bacterium]|nr:NTP transferase domain-containing protein [Trueperaceae bacterium]